MLFLLFLFVLVFIMGGSVTSILGWPSSKRAAWIALIISGLLFVTAASLVYAVISNAE